MPKKKGVFFFLGGGGGNLWVTHAWHKSSRQFKNRKKNYGYYNSVSIKIKNIKLISIQ